jgi:hypothetical protein
MLAVSRKLELRILDGCSGNLILVRDKSLLMPGRGPEEIFMNSKNFS